MYMTTADSSVPDFELPGTEGGEIEKYRLTEFTENGPVILSVYPFDVSPVCTDVLCRFRDAEFLTFTEDVDVLGISRDRCYSHMRFIDEYDLPFPLPDDTDGVVIDRFGLSYDEWEFHKHVSKRALPTIDGSKRIRYRWQTEDTYSSPNFDQLHQTVLSLVEENQ